jgi:hypothetical protein
MRSIHDPARHRIFSWRLACTTLGSAAAMVAGAWASGCSLIYDLSTAQCSTTSDCTARGGAFAELVCTDNLCQPVPLECTEHAQCTEKVSGEAACIQNTCVNLQTAECPVVLPYTDDLAHKSLTEDPGTLLLGGFATFDGTSQNSTVVRNYDLALTEFTSTYGGIPAAGGGTRRVVMVVCDSSLGTTAELDAAMAHLVDTVRAPGILANLAPDDLQRAIEEKGREAETFFMSPQPSDPNVVALGTNGLLYFIGPDDNSIARAYAPLLTRTLAHLERLAPITGPARVATVFASDQRSLNNMAGTIRSEPQDYGIYYNGKSRVENGNDHLSVSVTSAGGASFADQISQLRELKPHVIIAATGVEFLTGIVPTLEETWDDTSGQPRPFYLLSPNVFNSEQLRELLMAKPEIRTRIVGVNGAAAPEPRTLYNNYTDNWDAAYPEQRGVRDYENYYDAAYYLIYAAAAAAGGGSQAVGSELRLGMRRLLEGPEHDVGIRNGSMGLAMQALARGSITLNGTLGPPDFDQTTGVRQGAGSIWCMESPTSTKADVLRYKADISGDPTLATLEGNFPGTCIPDF